MFNYIIIRTFDKIKIMKNKVLQYEVNIGKYWLSISNVGYSYFKGEKRVIKN